jgi:hypothetical protein
MLSDAQPDTGPGDSIGSAGRERATGAAGRGPPSRTYGATGCLTLWADGDVSGPWADLDIGADKRTVGRRRDQVMCFNISRAAGHSSWPARD